MAKIIRNKELEDYRDFFDDDDIDDDVIAYADQPSQVAQHRLDQESVPLKRNKYSCKKYTLFLLSSYFSPYTIVYHSILPSPYASCGERGG